MDTDYWGNRDHAVESQRWQEFDRWCELLRHSFKQRDASAVGALLQPLALPHRASGDTPLERAILCRSMWGIEHLLALGLVPSTSNLDTFFFVCVGSKEQPAVLLDMWQAWLPWLEQQDLAFRSQVLASFIDWSRPYRPHFDDGQMYGRTTFAKGIDWESLQVSAWAKGCWDVPVELQEREGDPLWRNEGILSPVQRAWLGKGTELIGRLLDEGASPHRLHPASALPQWNLASMWDFLNQAKGKGRVPKHSCPALKGSQFEGPFPLPETALGATFGQPAGWEKVQKKMRVLALREGLPLPSSRASPSPRF